VQQVLVARAHETAACLLLAAATSAPEGSMLTLADTLYLIGFHFAEAAASGVRAGLESPEYAGAPAGGRVPAEQAVLLVLSELERKDQERFRRFMDDFSNACQGRLAPEALYQYSPDL
jgi:hypothetical protein